MANSITGINDDIILDKVLEGFTAGLTPLMAFATDCSPAPGRRGDTVSVMRLSAADAAATKVTHTDYTIQDADSDAIEVSLGQPIYVSWGLDDVEKASSSILNMERFGFQKGRKLAAGILADIWSLITNANYGAAVHTGTAANFDKDDVIEILNACDAANMPEDQRAIVVGPTYYNQLLTDSAVADASAFGTNSPIRRGVIPDFLGFDWYKSNLIPSNSENLVGFVCVPDGIAVAMRYLMPSANHKYSDARPMTDPGTGLTLGVRTWYDEDSGVEKRVVECVYGYALGIAAGLKRITSA